MTSVILVIARLCAAPVRRARPNRRRLPLNPNAIVFPAIAMFFLTATLVARMGFPRVRAVQRDEISIAYYRLYNATSMLVLSILWLLLLVRVALR